MDTITRIPDDDRPITMLVFPYEEVSYYKVGAGGATRIVAYNECGQMEVVPWFAVYEGDVLTIRVNAAHVETVHYAEQE